MNYLVQGPFHGDDDFNVLFVPLTPCYYTTIPYSKKFIRNDIQMSITQVSELYHCI